MNTEELIKVDLQVLIDLFFKGHNVNRFLLRKSKVILNKIEQAHLFYLNSNMN